MKGQQECESIIDEDAVFEKQSHREKNWEPMP